MAQNKQTIQSENTKLKAENERLKKVLNKSAAPKRRHMSALLRKVGMVFCIAMAVALLVVGNLFFWAGNTLTKTDRYTATVSPLIKNTDVQNAIALYGTKQLFSNVDVNQVISNALPPRADFLAPSIAGQVQSRTQETLQNILSNPGFQDKWNTIQSNAHQKFIQTVGAHGNDGSIDLNELYQQMSGNLKDTKLAFLADKPLPPKVGSIQVASGSWLTNLERVINHIDVWRTVALLLFVGFAAAGIWLSRKRRWAIIRLGVFLAVSMLITLISLRVIRETIVDKVDPAYTEGVRQAVQIVFHPLVVQTSTLLGTALLVSFIAWVSGPSRNAKLLKARVSDVFAGRLHGALFSHGENKLSLWFGASKRSIEWGIVAIITLGCLIIRLTPMVLLVSIVLMLILVLLTEVLSAPQPRTRTA